MAERGVIQKDSGVFHKVGILQNGVLLRKRRQRWKGVA